MGFFGIRDFPYLNLGIQDFLSKMGVRYGRIESIAVSRMPKKENIGITGLHEIWDSHCGIEESSWRPSVFCLFYFP